MHHLASMSLYLKCRVCNKLIASVAVLCFKGRSYFSHVSEVSCWHYSNDYQTVWNFTFLTLSTTTLCWRSFIKVRFQNCLESIWFFGTSRPTEILQILSQLTFHESFHEHHKCHYKQLEFVVAMITWSRNARHWYKYPFWPKSNNVTSVVNKYR